MDKNGNFDGFQSTTRKGAKVKHKAESWQKNTFPNVRLNYNKKVTFETLSVNHSEEDVIQTQSRKSAEKSFFKCPIKTHPIKLL